LRIGQGDLQREGNVDDLFFLKRPVGFPIDDIFQIELDKLQIFTEEQIIAVLKESEAEANTNDLCRKHGICGATLYKWKAK